MIWVKVVFCTPACPLNQLLHPVVREALVWCAFMTKSMWIHHYYHNSSNPTGWWLTNTNTHVYLPSHLTLFSKNISLLSRVQSVVAVSLRATAVSNYCSAQWLTLPMNCPHHATPPPPTPSPVLMNEAPRRCPNCQAWLMHCERPPSRGSSGLPAASVPCARLASLMPLAVVLITTHQGDCTRFLANHCPPSSV